MAMFMGMQVKAGTLEAYAVYDSSSKTLTFHNDTNKSSYGSNAYSITCNGENNLGWAGKEIREVIFELNMLAARPTSTRYWFYGQDKLTTITGIENLITSEVIDMSYMFSGCSSLKSIDLSHFDTSKVTSMAYMFDSCTMLSDLDLSTFTTTSLIYMQNMFNYCIRLVTIDLSSFNTSKVNFMNNLFYCCSSLTTIYAGSQWSTNSLIEKAQGGGITISGDENMFGKCTKLKGGKGTSYDANYVGKERARADGGTSSPGYLTVISDGILVNVKNFPDEYLRKELIGQFGKILYNTDLAETDLDLCTFGHIKDLTGIEKFTQLNYLNFSWNEVKAADLSKNTKLKTIYCYANQIWNVGMDNFISNLPTVTGGELYVYLCDDLSYLDGNEMTPVQVTAAKEKGWTVYVYDNTIGKYGDWSTTNGYWLLSKRFSDDNFRRALNAYYVRCMGALTAEDVNDCDDLNLYNEGIQHLDGIHYFTNTSSLMIENNQLQYMGLSSNTKLSYISCYNNKISGDAMNYFTAYLPNVTDGEIYVCYSDLDHPDNEGNEMTPAHVKGAKKKGWTVTLYDYQLSKKRETDGYYLIGENRFPDANLRSYLIDKVGNVFIETPDEWTSFSCVNKGISTLQGIELFKNLGKVVFYNNNVESVDLSNNTSLYEVSCFWNKINGVNMDNMIASLPTMPEGKVGRLYVINNSDTNHAEGNEMTVQQVQVAKAKRWTPYERIGNAWVEYTGNTGITTDIEEIENGELKMDSLSESWYTIDGQKLSGKPTKKGVYIRNGKAVVN